MINKSTDMQVHNESEQLDLHLGKRSTYFYLLIQTVSLMYLRLPA